MAKCKHCGLEVAFGVPHPEVDGARAWFHVEHGGITCGSLAEDRVAEPRTSLEAGERVRVVALMDDPVPIPVGTTGRVTEVRNPGTDGEQARMEWDNGRSLMLTLPHDLQFIDRLED